VETKQLSRLCSTAGLAIFSGLLLRKLWRRYKAIQRANAIPGPPASFILGNAGVLTAPSYRANRAKVWDELFDEYGPVVRLVMPIVAKYDMMVGFGSKEDALYILKHPQCQGRVGIFESGSLGQSLIFMSDTAVHDAHRKALMPMFTKRMLGSYSEVVTKELDRLVSVLKDRMSEGMVDFYKLLIAATYDIISEIAFSRESQTIHNPDDPAVRAGDRLLSISAATFLNPINRMKHICFAPLHRAGRVFLPSLVPKSPLHEAREYFVTFLEEAIQNQRRHGITTSFVGRALEFKNEAGKSLTDREIMGELLGLLLAGHETTANALTWALFLLARNPYVQDKVAAEVAGVSLGAESMAQLQYTTKVFYEALRLYPVVPTVGRMNHTDINIHGFDIPAKQFVMVCGYALSSKERDFNPDMAPAGGIQAGELFFPFGNGRRLCMGWQLAELEGTLLLAGLIQNFRFTDAGKPVEPSHDVTMGPKHSGCFLKFEVR